MASRTVKMSVNLPEEAVEALRALAEARGLTLTEVLRQAIINEKFLQEAQKEGAKILIDKQGQPLQQVVFR